MVSVWCGGLNCYEQLASVCLNSVQCLLLLTATGDRSLGFKIFANHSSLVIGVFHSLLLFGLTETRIRVWLNFL